MRGVLLPQRAGRRVARVRRRRLALARRAARSTRGSPRAACTPRRAPRSSGGASPRRLHPQRDRADRAQVRRHVLALDAVAARRAADEDAVLVDEVDRRAVDLRLEHERDRLVACRAACARRRPTSRSPRRSSPSRASPSARDGAPSGTSSDGGAPTRCVGESGVDELGMLGLERGELVVEDVVRRVRP